MNYANIISALLLIVETLEEEENEINGKQSTNDQGGGQDVPNNHCLEDIDKDNVNPIVDDSDSGVIADTDTRNSSTLEHDSTDAIVANLEPIKEVANEQPTFQGLDTEDIKGDKSNTEDVEFKKLSVAEQSKLSFRELREYYKKEREHDKK